MAITAIPELIEFVRVASRSASPSSAPRPCSPRASSMPFRAAGLPTKQKKGNLVKNSSWECGIPVEGNARTPFSIKYFLTAVLFVLFDNEIVFFYPYAVNFREFGMQGFLAVLTFVAIFFVAFFYVWKRGALDWDK